MPWLIILSGYLIGSFPTGYILGRVLRKRDIRQMGDANTGAENVYRELGRAAGVAVFFIDAGKGAAVIAIALATDIPQWALMLAGLATVIGHNWPVYTGFRGGRGVSTTIGILYVLVPIPALIITLPVVLVVYFARSTLPAMAFLFIVLPLLNWAMSVPVEIILYGIGLSILLGITHYLRTRQKRVLEEA